MIEIRHKATGQVLYRMRGADLRQANLYKADLQQADLRGADMRAQLDGANLKGARYDETTRWPMSFEPAKHGCISVGEVVPVAAPMGRGNELGPGNLAPGARGDH